jgi:hypothetical protein
MESCAGWGAFGTTLLSAGELTIAWAKRAEVVKLGNINKTEPDAKSSFNHRRFRTNQPILVVPQKLICLRFDADYGRRVSCKGTN